MSALESFNHHRQGILYLDAGYTSQETVSMHFIAQGPMRYTSCQRFEELRRLELNSFVKSDKERQCKLEGIRWL